jgi:outer membrane protein assembly factor BamA
MQFEANVEYRFPVYKIVNGAFFVDAGNIWLSKPDPNKPLGDFQLNRFYKEIAIGSGLGVRADFSFFIIRLDASIKIRDPSRAVNDRWMFSHMPFKTTVVNFGIGYPF